MYPNYPTAPLGNLGGTQCLYRSYPNLPQQSSLQSSSYPYRQQHLQQSQPPPPPQPLSHTYTRQTQQQSLPKLPGTGTSPYQSAKKNNCYYCNNNINLTCTCLSSSALGYFYSTSQTLHSSAPSTLNRRRSSIRNPPSVSFAAGSTGPSHQPLSYSSLPRSRRNSSTHHSRTPSTVAVGVQIPSPPTQPTQPAPSRPSQQHQESQVDEEMLGLMADGKPLGNGSTDDPMHDDEDDLDDPNSPPLSASPPPAPPPLPPPVRNGCQRCRFSLASANSTLNRSHPHLASGTGTLGSGSIGGGTLPRTHRGATTNGGTLERNHMGASSGHLHTAGGVTATVASAGTGNGTYPGRYLICSSIHPYNGNYLVSALLHISEVLVLGSGFLGNRVCLLANSCVLLGNEGDSVGLAHYGIHLA
uniref:Uncharacterized protein n=1 Tax=Anopheles culicifacies TaxID=139723 RepID=A0A182MPJ4_9DIPT